MERWLPSVVFGLGVVVLQTWRKRALNLPGAIVLSLILFYAWAFIVGGGVKYVDGGRAGSCRKCLRFSIGSFLILSAIQQITPAMLLASAGGIVITIIQCTLNLFFKASGQEIVTDRELEFNRECRVNGVANVTGGVFGGGLVGYHIPSMTDGSGSHERLRSADGRVTRGVVWANDSFWRHNLLDYSALSAGRLVDVCWLSFLEGVAAG